MQILVAVVFAVVAWVGVANAQAPAQLTPTEAITYTGTITEVNAPKRIVTTQGPDGFVATWEVPVTVPQAQIDALRVGQMLTVTYSDAISFRRKPAGEPKSTPSIVPRTSAPRRPRSAPSTSGRAP